jgi:iron complex outermembrane receptor protein
MQVRIVLFGLRLRLIKLSSSATHTHRVLRRVLKLALIAPVAMFGFPGFIAHSEQPPDLTQKSLADLMNIEVTSVSKREQKTSQIAAAVFVISRQDIDR